MRTDLVIRRTERWFVHQGVPYLIADYRFGTHVLPRMLPFLMTASVFGVAAALLLARTGSGPAVVAVGLVLLLGTLALPWLLSRSGRQLPRLSGNGVITVLVVFAAVPLVIPLLLLGAHGWTWLVGRSGASTAELLGGTALVLAAGFAAVFAGSALVTAYGLVPLAARATRHALTDMRGSLQLQGRAMPTLLFVTFFLFFTGELWQLMNHLAWGRLLLVLLLFAGVTVLATSARLHGEIDRVVQDLGPERLATACQDTPLAAVTLTAPPAPPPLTARQETNVLMVLATRQLVQAAVVGLGLFAFFVVLGLIVVDHTIAATWILAEPERSAWLPFVPVALLRAAALLAGFGSMYFAITTMTQKEYRQEFFEPVIAEVERTLAVRAVYLGLRAARRP